MKKLDLQKTGVAVGAFGALSVLVLGLIDSYSGAGSVYVDALARVYPGYRPSFSGAFVGAIWAFVDYFSFGVIAAWVWNSYALKIITRPRGRSTNRALV